MDRILELEAPELEPQPDDRNQIQLPLGENDAEEEARAQALMKEYGVDQPDYDLAAAEKKADERGDTQFRKRQVAQSYLRKLRGESVDPDAPEAMSGLLSGVPAELESQVKAILQDSMEACDYTASGLNLRLEPYWPPSEEEVDASDGRLTVMPPHFNLYVTYQVAAGPTYSYDEWPSQDHMAYTKVRGAVINTMRWLVLGESFALNPNALDLADDWVVFVFILFPRPKLAPPTPDEEIPF
jgi:hypothetical protein